jgi:hypothetical protein
LHPDSQVALSSGGEAVKTHSKFSLSEAEAAEVLRSLIDRMELRPGSEGQGIAATHHGDLVQILALCDSPGCKQKLPKTGA